MTGTPDRGTTLASLTARIAEIDAGIHEALIERAQICIGLTAIRRASGEDAPALSFGRDAEVMRELVERHHGDMPIAAVEHVWRTLLAASVSEEDRFAVHLDGAADLQEMLDLARFYFGFAADLEAGGDAADVVGAVAASERDLGLIALIDRADLPWWRGLSESGAQISARLPFLVTDGRPADLPALVIARAQAEPEDVDVAVFDARWSGVLPGKLMDQGIEVLSFFRSANGVDALLAVSADMSEEDVLAACAEAGAEPDVLRRVGGYPAPIDTDGDTDDDFGSEEPLAIEENAR